MQRRVPNRRMRSSLVRTMMNPQRERSRISVRKKDAAVGVRVEVCEPLEMALRMVGRNHLGPTSTGNT